MKTIEERATEYACDDGVMPDSYDCESCFNIYGKCTRDAYIAGAKSERKELTRWKDPVEQPEDGCICLLKFRSNGFFVHYEGGIFSKKDGEWHDSENMFTYNRDVILAWRPLYDMPG